MTERMTLQFRAEFFNALNHTQFGLPNANASAGENLGLTTTANPPRIIQCALKLSY